MDSFDFFPNPAIADAGRMGRAFLSRNVRYFHDACRRVKEMPYGYNSNPDDSITLFADGRGTCMSKHGVIAELAQELDVPVFKYVGFYRLDEQVIEGIGAVLSPFGLEYIPQTHCVLGFHSRFADLTSGNCHGKKKNVVDIDLFVRTVPNLDVKMKEDLYVYALRYFKRIDRTLSALSDEECLAIAKQCDGLHRNLCSIVRAVPGEKTTER